MTSSGRTRQRGARRPRRLPAPRRRPRCDDVETTNGTSVWTKVPCSATVGDAPRRPHRGDALHGETRPRPWHLLFAWKSHGSLYTVSQHVAAPLTYSQVAGDLERMLHDSCSSLPAADMPLTRRRFIAGAAAAALAGGSVSSSSSGRQRLQPGGRDHAAPREQHLLDGLRIIRDNGVEVVVPPLHMQVVTLELTIGDRRADLQAAAPRSRTRSSPSSAAPRHPRRDRHHRRLGPALLHRMVPALAATHPRSTRARRAPPAATCAPCWTRSASPATPTTTPRGERRGAPPSERQPRRRSPMRRARSSSGLDVCARPASAAGSRRRLRRRREPAAGAGARSRRPRRPAHPGGSGALPGLHLDPEARASARADRQLRDAGLCRRRPAAATSPAARTMHLSHIFEDLEAWYLSFDYDQRIATLFAPTSTRPGHAHGSPGPRRRRHGRRESARLRRFRAIGHSAAIQTASRLAEDMRRRRRDALPERARPCRSAPIRTRSTTPSTGARGPSVDRMASGAAAGVHFVVFNPTSDDFARTRLAMDGAFAGRHAAAALARRSRPGDQLGAHDDPPPELPRAAAPPPVAPARRSHPLNSRQ